MPKQLEITRHLTVAELETRYHSATEGIERSHYQIIWLLSRGKRSHEVADVTGYHVERVRQIVRRYNQHGPAALGDQRQHNQGKARLLTPEQETQLQNEAETAFAEGRPYNGPQLARRMSELLGRPVRRERGWELLTRWQHRLKVPRPQHAKQAPHAVETLKKT